MRPEDFNRAFERLYYSYTLKINQIIKDKFVDTHKMTIDEYNNMLLYLDNLEENSVTGLQEDFIYDLIIAFKEYEGMEQYYDIFIKYFNAPEM